MSALVQGTPMSKKLQLVLAVVAVVVVYKLVLQD
jgi:hypothetical protein